MIHDLLHLDEMIQILNRFVAADPVAMKNLIENRVPCNDTLARDPTCQVRMEHGGNSVGLLGILNGLLGIHESGPCTGFGPLSAVFSDDDKILYGFRRTVIPGFTVPTGADLPPEVKSKFEVFLKSHPKDAFTICENDIGWFLFPLGREGIEEPLFAVSRDR